MVQEMTEDKKVSSNEDNSSKSDSSDSNSSDSSDSEEKHEEKVQENPMEQLTNLAQTFMPMLN